MADPGKGVLFVAAGSEHVARARDAAASVRATNPGLAIGLFAERAERGSEFDVVEPIEAPRSRSKVDCLWRTPFASTLYLDTDTRVLADLTDLFRVLERFDLAIAQAQRYHKRTYRRLWRADIPVAFPQFNSGVMLYRSTPQVLDVLRAWTPAYDAAGIGSDQVSLRELLWLSDLRCHVLPPAYNVRSYNLAERHLSDRPEPVILHLPRFNARRKSLAQRLSGLGLRRP